MVVAPRELGIQTPFVIAPPENIRVASLTPQQETQLRSILGEVISEVSSVSTVGAAWDVRQAKLNAYPNLSEDERRTAEKIVTALDKSIPQLADASMAPVVKLIEGAQAPIVEEKEKPEIKILTQADIDSIPDATEVFKVGARSLLWYGMLDSVCREMLHKRAVETRKGMDVKEAMKQALALLNEDSKEYPQSVQYPTRGAMNGKPSKHSISEFKKLINQARDPAEDELYRRSGVVIHDSAAFFERHEIWRHNTYRRTTEDKLRAGVWQLSLYQKRERGDDWQPLDPASLVVDRRYLNDVGLLGVSQKYVDDLRKKLTELERVTKEYTGLKQLVHGTPVARDLLYQLGAILSPQVIYRVLATKRTIPRDAVEAVAIQTAKALAYKFLDANNHDRKLVVDEIMAWQPKRFGKPRIDGLIFDSLGGKEPDEAAFKWALDHNRFLTAGDAIRSAELEFRDTQWQVVDYKSVFRHPSPEKIREHVEYTKSYGVLAEIGRWIEAGARGVPWRREIRGYVEYISPNGPPVREHFTAGRDEQELVYESLRELSRNSRVAWTANTEYARNVLLGCARRRMAGTEKKLDVQRKGEKRHVSKALEKLDKKKSYLDPARQLGERVGISRKTGKPIYQVDYADLVEAIENKELGHTGYHEGAANYWVECFNPKHQDSDPSMQVTRGDNRDLIHCYVCPITVFIKQEETSSERPFVKSPTQRLKEVRHTMEKYASPEQIRIMADAQEIFSNSFKGSRGEAYVRSRGIDPKLAHESGAGFADHHLLRGLRAKGWSDEKLVFYGFMGIRPKEVKVKTSDGYETKVVEEKYFKWNGRVTYPLYHHGQIVGFYARAVWKFDNEASKRKSAHRKSKIAEHMLVVDGKETWFRSPQGADGADNLTKNPPYIILNEASFDKRSLMQMGFQNIIALIGINNKVSMEEIAGHPDMPVFLAFDADSGGSKSTLKAHETLRAAGHRGPIINLTARVFRLYAEVRMERGLTPPQLASKYDWEEDQGKSADKRRNKFKAAGPKDYNELLMEDADSLREALARLKRDPWEQDFVHVSKFFEGWATGNEEVNIDIPINYAAQTESVITPNGNGLIYANSTRPVYGSTLL